MNTHADKTQKNKSQSGGNTVFQKQINGESTFQLVDNRPEALAQRKLNEMANNSPQSKKYAQLKVMADNYSSQANAVSQRERGGESTLRFKDNRPEALAQRKLQEMANNSPQVKLAKQLQAMVANNVAQKKSNGKQGFGIVDSRTKAGMERKVVKSNFSPIDSKIDDNPSLQPIQLLPANVSALLNQVANQDPSMANAKFYVAAVSDWLTLNRLPHRLGGSLSARLQGANRTPGDVDIETQGETALCEAYILVIKMNGLSVTINGNTATCNVLSSKIQSSVFAQVRLQFTAPNNRSIIVNVDIANENNPTFNQHIKSPQSRGVAAAYGDLVSGPELVMNYLDRIIKKPEIATIKEDHKQILQILRSNGFNPSSQSDFQILRDSIASIAQPPYLQDYLSVLKQVIDWGLENPF